MAKAAFSQPPVRPRGASSPLLAAVGLAVLVGLALTFSGPADTFVNAVFSFLEYYAGVFTLVSLTTTVMAGLAATDRIVLLIRHRILLQAVHRAAALAAMTFLAIHVSLKILEGHATVLDAAVPFLAANNTLYLGLGTVASLLMIMVAWTGVVRSRFAGSAHPGIWRVLHAATYLCRPIALGHGLQAGRPAKAWVTVSYAVCLILVVVALVVRVSVSWGKRHNGPKATTSGTIRAVGRPLPRSAPAAESCCHHRPLECPYEMRLPQPVARA